MLMSEAPKISVILPVYNGADYIAEAIQSVLEQSFESFEFIIINDGSSDNSEQIILSFADSRIVYIKNPINLGLIKTLNKGVSLAKAEYIARMDADDVCEKNRFRKQYQFLNRHPDYLMCGSWVHTIDECGKITGRIKRISNSELIRANMLFTTPLIHPSVMIRADVLKDHLYSEDAKHCEDMELWPRLAFQLNGKFYNIKKNLLNYRIHSQNISVVHLNFQNESRLRVLSPYVEKLIDRSLSDKEKRIHFLTYHLSQYTPTSQEINESKEWFRYLLECNKKTNMFAQNDLAALLFSRWMVLCLRTKRWGKFLSIHLPWYNPDVLIKTAKLLLYK